MRAQDLLRLPETKVVQEVLDAKTVAGILGAGCLPPAPGPYACPPCTDSEVRQACLGGPACVVLQAVPQYAVGSSTVQNWLPVAAYLVTAMEAAP